MSILSNLKINAGSRTAPKRVGRGRGSGLGQTAGKGHKGQLARSGGKVRRGFEGGQTPLYRRMPKFGFSNHDFKTTYSIVNVEQLNQFTGEVTVEKLLEAGLVKHQPVKILGAGKLDKKLTVKANAFSKSAMNAITSAGGQAEVVRSV